MNPYNEVYLRCRELGNAAHVLGPLGTDIICKVIIDKGVGHVMKDQTDDGHLVELRGHHLANAELPPHGRRWERGEHPRDFGQLCPVPRPRKMMDRLNKREKCRMTSSPTLRRQAARLLETLSPPSPQQEPQSL